MAKLTQRQLLTICDRNIAKRKKKGRKLDVKSYRRGFFNPAFKKESDK